MLPRLALQYFGLMTFPVLKEDSDFSLAPKRVSLQVWDLHASSAQPLLPQAWRGHSLAAQVGDCHPLLLQTVPRMRGPGPTLAEHQGPNAKIPFSLNLFPLVTGRTQYW